MAKSKISREQRKAIRDARKMIEQIKARDSNEAETRMRVERIFENVLGYSLDHLSRERAVRGAGETEHVDYAVQLEHGPDARPMIMVELKRVGVELARKHLKQVTSYAINAGCEWILLTNGREWKIYHVEFGQPPKVEILDTWDLLEDDVDKLVKKFEIISYKSIRRDGLSRLWKRVKVLAPKSLLSAMVAQDTLGAIRRNLRKNTGILVNNEEVYVGINKLLNEPAAVAMSSIKITKPAERTAKRRAKQEETEIEDEASKKEEGEATSEPERD